MDMTLQVIVVCCLSAVGCLVVTARSRHAAHMSAGLPLSLPAYLMPRTCQQGCHCHCPLTSYSAHVNRAAIVTARSPHAAHM